MINDTGAGSNAPTLLSASSAVALGTVGLAVAAAGVYGLASPDSGDLFQGWQVTTTRVALVVLGLLIAGPCVVVLARRLPRLPILHQWALLPALLLGVLLGGLTWSALDPVLSWASDQTTAAADFRNAIADDPRSPHIGHTGHPATAPAIAALLLRPDLLGPGWFDVFEPSPHDLPDGHSVRHLVKANHALGRWTIDALCIESTQLLSSAAAAQEQLTRRQSTPAPVLHQRVVAGVVVYVWDVSPSRVARHASFRRGNRVWSMTIGEASGRPALTSAETEAVIAAAVRRSAG